jgi:hypothetical protein
VRGLAKKGDDGVCGEDGAGEEPRGLACGAYLGDDAGGMGDDMMILCEAGSPDISMCVCLGDFSFALFSAVTQRATRAEPIAELWVLVGWRSVDIRAEGCG